jgi:chromosome segregation ATPase
MDERKKTIGELEARKRETLNSLNARLETLGEVLLSRAENGAGLPETAAGENKNFREERAEYRRLQQELADSRAHIRRIEDNAAGLKDLEARIASGEKKFSALSGELQKLHIRLGKACLEDPTCAAAYREKLDALLPRIESLEGLLDELGGQEPVNALAWIRKSTRTAVNRSLLTKNRRALDAVYEKAGEAYTQAAQGRDALPAIPGEAASEAAEKSAALHALALELEALRTEYRKAGAGLEGGPRRRIRGIEKHSGHVGVELALLRRRFGEKAAGSGRKGRFAALIEEEDKAGLGGIAGIKKELEVLDREIEKHRAGIAIDGERAVIEKYIKTISRHREKIAAAETVIAELSGRIAAAEKHIEELQGLL